MRPPDSRPQIDAIMMIDAAAALLHVRHGQARGADRGEQRFVERRLPFGVGRAEQVGAGGAADVVDQDVEPAEHVDGAVDDQLDARRGATRRPARSAIMFGRFAAASTSSAASASVSAAARAEHDAAAFGDQRPRAGQPEPAARAGDDRNLVGES